VGEQITDPCLIGGPEIWGPVCSYGRPSGGGSGGAAPCCKCLRCKPWGHFGEYAWASCC